MPRVLVLGGSGFVGRHLMRALRDCGWAKPIAAQRRPAPQPGIETVTLDATDAAALREVLSSVSHVVACISGSPRAITASARNLFAAASRQPNITRVIHFSSMAVYGAASGLIDEAAPLDGTAGGYAGAKVAAERAAQSYAAGGGEVVILRPGCIHGPGSEQWTGRIARLLRARRIGEIGAAGEGFCNLSYIDDVIAAVLVALRQEGIAGEAFNIANPDPESWNTYFARLARAIGAAPLARIPRWRLEIEARLLAPPLTLGRSARAQLGLSPGPEAISPGLLRYWSQKTRLNSIKAAGALRLAWTPHDAAIAAAGEWFLTTLPGARA